MSGLVAAPLSESYAQWIGRCEGWTLYHLPEWLQYLDETAPGSRLDLGFYRRGTLVGLMPTRELRLGPVRLLGSPMPGWTTPYMGPVWREPVEVDEFFEALTAFLRERRIRHAELTAADPHLERFPGWVPEVGYCYVSPLCEDPDILLAGFSKSCRKTVRRAERKGVRVEFTDDERFITEYYQQLEEVFAKSHLRPTYSIEKVRALWRHLKPAARLLTAWARVGDEVIATRIDAVGNRMLHSFGSASRQDALKHCPNEVLRYFVMRWAGQQGLTSYEMTGGGGYYKAKFNAEMVSRVRLIRSPFWLRWGRAAAKKMFYWLKHRRGGDEGPAEKEQACDRGE